MAEFVSRLQELNALADGSAGFVWRLQTEDGSDGRRVIRERVTQDDTCPAT
jgi:Domain of unknown function (DUF3291)